MAVAAYSTARPLAHNDNVKPKGDAWAALIRAVSPWPSIQAHAWRRRSEGWTVAAFCDEAAAHLGR